MKEAAGEANLTVVAIILIGVVVAVATPLVTNLMGNTVNRACCTDAGGVWIGGTSQCDFSKSSTGAGGDSAYQQCVNNSKVKN